MLPVFQTKNYHRIFINAVVAPHGVEAKQLSARAACAEEVNYGADGWEGVALGRRQADIECGFELIAELDQVKGVSTKITNKGGVEAHLRRREVEVPCDDGLDACLYGSFHLPRILPRACQRNVNAIKTIPALFN